MTDFTVNDQSAPSDGVITGYGQIEGNPVYVYSQNRDVLNGTMGEMHAKKIAKLYDMADKADSSGDRTVRLRRLPSAGVCRCTGQLWHSACKTG
ncbi:MAG: carboxyl transferase domain-containing protein [Eubacterium ramulus]